MSLSALATENAGNGTGTSGLSYLLADHLGSTSRTTDGSGTLQATQLYKAWGEVRWSSRSLPTRYTFTGQYTNMPEFGLMYFGARWLDPWLGRFAQADTIIPQNQGVQAWDRYAYVNNNPVKYSDPSGHCILCYLVAISVGVVVGAVTYDQVVAPALGRSPDQWGIDNVGKYMNPATDSITVRYKCNDAPCDYGTDDLLSSQWNLYDGQTVYWSGLTSGKLTGQRAFVCFANDSNACYTGYDPGYTRLMFADTQYEYDTWGNQTKVKAYSGYGYFVVATSQSVLATSGLSETTSCYGNGTAPTCNDDGYHTYKTWERNSLGHTTYWSYSGVIWPGSAYTGYTIGAPVSETGPNGASTIVTAEYDQFGRMTKVIRPGHGDSSASPTVSISYHDSPAPFYTNATQKIDASTSLVVRKFYDGLGRLIQTQTGGAVLYDNACSGDGDTTPDTCDVIADREYDGYGNPTSQSVPYAVSTGTGYRDPLSQPQTTTTYDILGRVRVVTAPDGNSTETSYPATPNGYSSYSEVRVENARGNVTRTLSDAWGRAKIVIPLNGINDGSPITPTVSYSYSALDQLESATRGGAMVDPSYDYAGRKVKQIDPDLGTWYYSYNGMGLPTSQKDARCSGGSCVTTNFQYDAIGRLTQKSYTIPGGLNVAATSTVNYSYDAGTNGIGQRTSMSDGSGSTTWSYDVRGRVTQESKAISGSGTFVTQYTYNTGDQVATLTYPSNGTSLETLTYTYYNQGTLKNLMSTVSGTNYYLVEHAEYDTAGHTRWLYLGASSLGATPVLVNEDYYYPWTSQGGRLQYSKSGIYTNWISLQKLEYGYDANGNISWIKDYKAGVDASHPQQQSFEYDNLDRLHTAGATGGLNGNGDYSQSYTYHATTGNLDTKSGNGTYTYGDTAHKHAVTALSQAGWSFQYDANGNMTRRNIGSSVYDFSYDAENRMTGVSNAVSASFVYDGDGARVKGTVGGVTTAYIGSHFEWTGSTGKKYFYAGGRLVGMRSGTGASTTNLTWLTVDHLGSTSKVANGSTGAQNDSQTYKAWGENRYPTTSTLPTTKRYTGQRHEPGLGIYWYGSRWYDPWTGRFLSPDTIIPEASQGVQAWDRYAGMNNNPVNNTDPLGHMIDKGETGSALLNQLGKPIFPFGDLKPDATVRSVGFTAGIGDAFWTVSFDLVTTNYPGELGLFVSPRATNSPAENYLRTATDDLLPAVTPQLGVGYTQGPLFGDSLNESVLNYSGPFTYLGGSVSSPIPFVSATGDVFASNDEVSGSINANIVGYCSGTGFGVSFPPSFEAHGYVTNSIPIFTLPPPPSGIQTEPPIPAWP